MLFNNKINLIISTKISILPDMAWHGSNSCIEFPFACVNVLDSADNQLRSIVKLYEWRNPLQHSFARTLSIECVLAIPTHPSRSARHRSCPCISIWLLPSFVFFFFIWMRCLLFFSGVSMCLLCVSFNHFFPILSPQMNKILYKFWIWMIYTGWGKQRGNRTVKCVCVCV